MQGSRVKALKSPSFGRHLMCKLLKRALGYKDNECKHSYCEFRGDDTPGPHWPPRWVMSSALSIFMCRYILFGADVI